MYQFQVQADYLAQLATVTAFCSTDKGRPLLTGVLLEVVRDGDRVTARATATDSYRLAVITRDALTDSTGGVSVIVLGKGFADSVKLATNGAKGAKGYRSADHVTVTVDPERGLVTFTGVDGVPYGAPIVDWTYPNTTTLIPAPDAYSKGDGTASISMDPQFLATFAKIHPWNIKGATIKLEFLDYSRPVMARALFEGGETVALMMPKRVP